ncbi:hypothetical protein PSY31_23000, partial [Shigella flexneri]|nr:hypothetical protein [Shigella flexneri]
TAEFTEVEIKTAVWSCQGEKSAGPDGFNFSFIQEFWEVVKEDFTNFLTEFYHTGKLSSGIGSSLITLQAKVDNPVMPSEYRPISLIGCA